MPHVNTKHVYFSDTVSLGLEKAQEFIENLWLQWVKVNSKVSGKQTACRRMPSARVNTAVLPGLVSLATAVETCADKDKLTKREWQHLQRRQERLGEKKKKRHKFHCTKYKKLSSTSPLGRRLSPRTEGAMCAFLFKIKCAEGEGSGMWKHSPAAQHRGQKVIRNRANSRAQQSCTSTGG